MGNKKQLSFCTELFVVSTIFFLSFPTEFYSQHQSKNESFLFSIKNKASVNKKAIYFNKSKVCFEKKEWDSVLVYSMKQLDQTNDSDLKDYCYYFRGFSFKEKKLFNQAKLEFDKISNNFQFYYHVSLNLGDISLSQGNYQEAIRYFKPVEELLEKASYDVKKSGLYHNLGLCYFHLGQYEEAEKYLFKSVNLYSREKDTFGLIVSYMDIANLYYEQYQDALAIPYYEKAYQLSKKVNSFELKQNAALNMAVVEENRKNTLASLAYRKEYEAWHDSLNDQNKVWSIAQLEKQFAVKQKQKEVDVLEVENQLKISERNGFIYAAALLLLLLGTGVVLYRQNVKRSKIILSQKIELDALNAAKDNLFSIVSHDLRSSVNALKSSNSKLQTNLETKNYEALDLLLHSNSAIANGAYNLLDNLLHWALLQTEQSYFKQEALRLQTIIEHVVYNYKPLMLEQHISFENTVPKSTLVFADQESLKIILRNLFDNAIKFSPDGGKISVYLRNTTPLIELVVEDTGLGINASTRLSLLEETPLLSKKKHEDLIGSGLGLQLCKSMIKKNGGIFNIESEENQGTKMIVSLLKTESNG